MKNPTLPTIEELRKRLAQTKDLKVLKSREQPRKQ
jgi:hypothetical protein